MHILITGNKGFIGQNMVAALAEQNKLSFYEWGDPAPKISGLDWVIHLGAISTTTERDVEKVMQQNYDFSCWLLAECVVHNVNLQYSSSASVYGLSTDFSEDSPLDPKSPYAWSKYLFDRFVEKHRPYPITVQGFRYFNVYGPHEDHKGDQASPYHKFEKQARETGVIKIFENSDRYFRDFVHVKYVVEIHKKMLNIHESGIFNVGTGTPKSFEDVAREVATKYDAKIEFIPMPEQLKSQYQTYTKAEMKKLQNVINKYNK